MILAMDEVRFERIARSASWIRLSYANQKSGQSLGNLIR
jgi:hypothetical protein